MPNQVITRIINVRSFRQETYLCLGSLRENATYPKAGLSCEGERQHWATGVVLGSNKGFWHFAGQFPAGDGCKETWRNMMIVLVLMTSMLMFMSLTMS